MYSMVTFRHSAFFGENISYISLGAAGLEILPFSPAYGIQNLVQDISYLNKERHRFLRYRYTRLLYTRRIT